MDWTTMSSLYGNVDDYKSQLRKLEQYCQSNPNDPASHFVLAYQYLATDSKDNAVNASELSSRISQRIPRPGGCSTHWRLRSHPRPRAAAAATPAGSDAPETDLVGNWRAKAGDTTIDLAITEDSQFTWKATPEGKPRARAQGRTGFDQRRTCSETKDQGSMAGSVKSLGPDSWQFALSGAPAAEPGLSFERVKN